MSASDPSSTTASPASGRGRLLLFALALTSALLGASAMLSWRSLVEPPDFTTPVLVLALLVGLTSGALRVLGAPDALAWLVAAAAGATVPLHVATGSWWPTLETPGRFADQVRAELDVVAEFAVPIGHAQGSLTTLFTLVALVLVLLLDVTLVSRPWVALGGLAVLTVHVVPANLSAPTSWGAFAAVALLFTAALALVRSREVQQWRSVDVRAVRGPGRPRVHWSWLATAASVGVGATVLAVLVGAVTPVEDTALWDRAGAGAGSDQTVTIANPLVDLRRDLDRGEDTELLMVQTDAGTPRYVRTAVLTEYDGAQWSTGDRRASASQIADGPLPAPPGLAADVDTRKEAFSFDALPGFRSRWLPLPEHAGTAYAEGDWRYDEDTRDFVAWADGLDTDELSWDSQAVVPALDAEDLDGASRALPRGGRRWTELPDDLPQLVSDLADEVTRDAGTPFRQAKALQSWFRSEFSYSLERVGSVGDDDLTAFLSPEGRVGYCEQFSASMALMARSLGIPARVAVGFLEPEVLNREQGIYVFSSHDMHAWPELYFEGAGWVRFEPTPGDRADDVPSYTRQRLDGEQDPSRPSASPRPSTSASPSPSAAPTRSPAPAPDDVRAGEDAEQDAARTALGVAALVLLVAAIAGAPRWWRRRLRARRLSSDDPEQWWEEVRAGVVDLGLPWGTGLSVREQGSALAELAAPGDGETDAQVRDALRGLTDALEHHRYAPAGSAGRSLAVRDHVPTVLDAIGARCSRGDRVLARWVPRSLLQR